MPNRSASELWLASTAIVVGGGSLLEHGYEFSLMSAALGAGVILWVVWIAERVDAYRQRLKGENRSGKTG